MNIADGSVDALAIIIHYLRPVLEVPNFLDGGVESMSGGEPVIGLLREAGDGGGQSPNLELDALLVEEGLLHPSVHRLHQQIRHRSCAPDCVFLGLLGAVSEEDLAVVVIVD